MIEAPLHPKTRAVLHTIAELWEENGEAPTIRQITDKAGYDATSAAYYQLNKLQREGLVKARGNKAGIYLTPRGWDESGMAARCPVCQR